jgi:hypothetical protein
MKTFQWGALLAIVLSAFFLASCGDNVRLESITVSPATPAFVCCTTTTQQFTATAHFSNRKTADFTNIVSWSSGDTTLATVDSHGLATATGGGLICTVTNPGPSSVLDAGSNVVITASLTPPGKQAVVGTAEWLHLSSGGCP